MVHILNYPVSDSFTSKFKQKENKKFKVGDTITFWGGYNGDIQYQAEIVAINGDYLYISWDCYWLPILDDTKRKIMLNFQ